MDSTRSPPSPTWLPSARPQGTSHTSHTSYTTTALSPSISARSSPPSRPLSSSTHLLQDLEPRTYDSQSDAESEIRSESRGSPPTTLTPKQRIQARKGMNIPSRSRPRWTQMQEYRDGMEEEEQHPLDPTPEPISRHPFRPEDELPRWARITEDRRRGSLPVSDGRLEDVQPGWMRGPPKEKEEIKFSIPPPITASVMFGSGGQGEGLGGKRYKSSEESILSSIFGAFPGARREGRGSGDIKGRNGVSRFGEEWTDILRQERGLQGGIQELLDLQASGLQRTNKPNNNGRDSRLSIRSGASVRSSSTLNGRNLASGKRALHTARLELLKAMYTLSDLAAAKEAVLEETSQTLEDAHKQLLSWQRKLSVAVSKIRELGDGADASGTEESIERQMQDVDREIEELDRRLKEAKEKKKTLTKKKMEKRSAKEAGVSRWVEAKREINKEVQRWMRHPGVPADMLEQDTYWSHFLELNPQRRNLEVAIEGLGGAIRGVRKRIAGVQTEADACERGAKMWSECLETVMKAEKSIKEWMERSLRGKIGLGSGLEELVEFMEETQGELQESLEVAEKEGWNLIVCALGAEIEALTEGLEIMRKMAGSGNGRQQTRAFDRPGKTKQQWKDTSQTSQSATDHADTDVTKQRRHSVTTNSTEDPMWGSGVDKDAEVLSDPTDNLDAGFEELKQLQQEAIPVLSPTKERRASHQSECGQSKHSIEMEGGHIIHTEGLKISPAHSPWLNSTSTSPVKAMVDMDRDHGTASPDIEVSFKTAMEHSINVDVEKARSRSESPVALTPREERVPPHRRKGAEKMDGGRHEESDDGEVPVDLLG